MMRTARHAHIPLLLLTFMAAAVVPIASVAAANVIANGTFAVDRGGWTHSDNGNGTVDLDSAVYGADPGSIRDQSIAGSAIDYTGADQQSIGTINADDSVLLSLYWYKYSGSAPAAKLDISVVIVKPDLSTATIWSHIGIPDQDTSMSGVVTNRNVAAFFDQTGAYAIRLVGDMTNGSTPDAFAQFNLDDVVLDVSAPANNPPQVAPGVTQVQPSPANRVGARATTISAAFYDADQPGIAAFNCTFRIREPNNATELTLVDNQPHGAGGLTITDNGGGWYIAAFTYDPDDAQVLGAYDLYFAVSDGIDGGVDDYAANADELEIIQQNTSLVMPGATQVSVSPVNRFALNTTTFSTTFLDADQPGTSAFRVTYKIRLPDDATELVLVDDLPTGVGGVTITDNGGGSYTAAYTYNPDDAQTLGLYDLYFEVSDGTGAGIDHYLDNVDELEIVEVFPNNPPWVDSSAARVSVSPVNRYGTNTTLLSASFADYDNPGIDAFIVTFKIRLPDDATELTLVDNQVTGAGGLTIADNGGSYTAKYTYNPDGAQDLGSYDLYFAVSDGIDGAVDDYANNTDELEISETVANAAPVLTPGTTTADPASLDRFGPGTTEVSAVFSDANQPGAAAFAVTFMLRGPHNVGLVTLADALRNGQSGLTITDGDDDSYTARMDWDPPDDATVGAYDLYCLVSDGFDQGVDGFDDNSNELTVTHGGENAPPIVPSDNTFASPAAIERIGANVTTIAATFTDADAPPISAFEVTFKLRDTNNVDETVLADNAPDGISGVSIVDLGAGVYTASVTWNPSDIQPLGFYDLYFHVTDGIDTSYDGFANNLDELEVFDALTNNPPTLTPGTTSVIPATITRLGSEYTMIQAVFSDTDVPGQGAFAVTIKVRDPASAEYTIVNAAHHKEQGLRIEHVSGDDYRASVLWDPPEGQVIGTYDLYFYVADNEAASVVDDYLNNADELTVTATAIAGDGNLLHRTNDAANCGGADNACHNILDHQSQDCLVCHVPHATRNIYLVRDTIQTPNSGARAVVFKTLGIGDPYNDPDPVVGDASSGAMADATDGVYTGVCEVCHTTTAHHRNNSSTPPGTHYDARICTGCHPHEAGFPSGESEGGISCTCHEAILATMDSVSTLYRHILANDDADYSPGASGMYTIKNCLTCHVDHDIFRPDLNTGIGQRARNLRVDYATDPVQGDNAVLANSDYATTGEGGICLSCHTGNCTGCHLPLKTATVSVAAAAEVPIVHVFLSKSDYDATTSTHNYNVTSTFTDDGSTFNANCVKCHRDDMSRMFQSSTHTFSAHGSNFSMILDTSGVGAPSNPLEEDFCFKCHSTSSNPNAGSNLDYFGVKAMTDTSLDIEAAFGLTYAHPTELYSDRHSPLDSAALLADGNRHAECEDCHNPHAARQGTHDGSSNLVSNALTGVWGVEPTAWPAAPTPTDNANVFAAPADYSKVDPALKEYQICLKCHSNYTTLPSGARNLAAEINPNYPSAHGIVAAGDNPYCDTLTMNEPWASSKIAWCSDCHRSSDAADPNGPHGSNLDHLLVATIASSNIVGTPLCYVCHLQTVYWTSSIAAGWSGFTDHPSRKIAHKTQGRNRGCFACHMWDYASRSDVGVNDVDDIDAGEIFIHGQNKVWVYSDRSGSGTGQSSQSFLNGYTANADHVARTCWSETCHVHTATWDARE